MRDEKITQSAKSLQAAQVNKLENTPIGIIAWQSSKYADSENIGGTQDGISGCDRREGWINFTERECAMTNATTFDVKQLPPDLAKAIASATPETELILVDNHGPVAKIVVCPPSQARIAGLHAGTIQVADDFDAPLSDEFWTGAR